MTTKVYIIGERDSNVLKIGIAHNTAKRLRNLRTANPYDIEILWERSIGSHARMIEQRVHVILACVRIRGEWFRISLPDAIAAIEETIESEPLERMRREWRDAWQARIDRQIAVTLTVTLTEETPEPAKPADFLAYSRDCAQQHLVAPLGPRHIFRGH